MTGTAPRAGASVGAAIAAMAVLLAGCSSGSGSGAQAQSQTSAIPPASRAQASASRTYLAGPGHGLIQLDDLAGKVAGRRTVSDCRADEKTLVRLTRGDGGPAVADPGLAELFGDEFSAVASVLAQCTRGDVPASALVSLGRVRALVAQRLRADKARP